MTVQQLIDKLTSLKHHDATIHIVVGDKCKDAYDSVSVQVFSDHTDDGYQDIFGLLDKDAEPPLLEVLSNAKVHGKIVAALARADRNEERYHVTADKIMDLMKVQS